MGIQLISADGETYGQTMPTPSVSGKGRNTHKKHLTFWLYLITTGGDKPLPTYGAMPAIAEKTDAFFGRKARLPKRNARKLGRLHSGPGLS